MLLDSTALPRRPAPNHRLLSEFYGLSGLEQRLEVPLDSYVAKAIGAELPGKDLPKWPGVKHLTPQISMAYQTTAAQIGAKEQIARVHLDLRWWRP